LRTSTRPRSEQHLSSFRVNARPEDDAWRRRRRGRFNVGRVLVVNSPTTSLFIVWDAAGRLLIMPGGSPYAGLKDGPCGGNREPCSTCCGACRHSSTSFCTACQRADDPSSTWLIPLRRTSDPRPPPPPSPPPLAPPPSPPSPSACCACNRCSFRLLRSRSRRAERQSAQHACLGLKNFSGRYRLHALHSERASGNMSCGAACATRVRMGFHLWP